MKFVKWVNAKIKTVVLKTKQIVTVNVSIF